MQKSQENSNNDDQINKHLAYSQSSLRQNNMIDKESKSPLSVYNEVESPDVLNQSQNQTQRGHRKIRRKKKKLSSRASSMSIADEGQNQQDQDQDAKELINVERQKNLYDEDLKDAIFYYNGKIKKVTHYLSQLIIQLDKRSLYIFNEHNIIRKASVMIVESSWFDTTIIVLIILNSILLAINDYKDRENETKRNQIIQKLDIGFTTLFLLECVLKIIEMGFIMHKNSYLRNGWNWLDFIVVVTALINMLPGLQGGASNFKAIRTFRVLRPLRSINAIPSMRILIGALIKSLPALGNVVIFLMFICLLFAILGVQLFSGLYYNRCRLTQVPLNIDNPELIHWPINHDVDILCGGTCEDLVEEGEVSVCGNAEIYSIPIDREDIRNTEFLHFGFTSFDNIGYAMLSVFQFLTFEQWANAVYNYIHSTSAVIAFIYFFTFIVIGGFFLLNLILAVIMSNFDKHAKKDAELFQQKQKKAKMLKEEQEKKKNNSRSASINEQAIKENQNQILIQQEDEESEESEGEEQDQNEKEVDVEENEGDGEEERNYNKEDEQLQRKQFEEQESQSLAESFHSDNVQKKDDKNEKSKKQQLNAKNSSLNNEEFGEQIPLRAEQNRLYKFFYIIAINSIFNILIMLLIIANTVVLAFDRHPISDNEANNIEKLNLVFTWCFLGEMMIKLIGLGIKAYCIDPHNAFDGVIVIFSTIEAIIQYSMQIENSSGVAGAVSALRAIRLLKIFKLAKKWKSFQIIIKKVGMSIKDIGNFAVLLFIFLYIFTLVGMELFANQVKFDGDGNVVPFTDPSGESEQWNYDDFLNAFSSVFIVTMTEDWNWLMFDFLRATSVWYCFYFIAVVIIVQNVLMALFTAILLKNFEDQGSLDSNMSASSSHKVSKSSTKAVISTFIREKFSFFKKKTQQHENENAAQNNISQKSETENSKRVQNMESSKREDLAFKKHDVANLVFKQKGSLKKDLNIEGRSIYLFGPKNKLRIIIARLVNNVRFDYLILILIGLSAIHLALESPLDNPNGQKVKIMQLIDIVFTTLFTLECIVKIIATGFVNNGKGSYLRNAWNVLDLFVVTLSILSLSMQNVNLAYLRVLRMLRILRPLRMISKNKNLKIAVLALFNSIPGVTNVLIISVFFMFLFGILGVTFMKGGFYRCDDAASNIYDIVHKWDCLNAGGIWVNEPHHFDNIFRAMLTLFFTTTREGWPNVLYSGMDISGEIDYEPIHQNYKYIAFFLFAWMLFGSVFLVNLFVGVVVNAFNSEKQKLGKNHLLTESQRQWIEVQLISLQYKPIIEIQMTGQRIRDFCIKLSQNKYFDFSIIICIMINSVFLSLRWYDYPKTVIQVNDLSNIVFTAIFTLEAIIKIYAMKSAYFRDGWNTFDFGIVVITLIFTIVERSGLIKSSVGNQATVLRAFRIFRLFKLAKSLKTLRIMFNTLINTIPSIANVGGLLLLILFIYSVLGIQLFAPLKFNGDLNVDANFKSFFRAFLTLARAATGEDWQDLMFDSELSYSIDNQCINSPSYEDYKNNDFETVGCGGFTSIIYHVSFQIIVTYIFLNLFVAVVIEGFENSNDTEGLPITEYDLEILRQAWKKYDPQGKCFIKIKNLESFIIEIAKTDSQLIQFKQHIKNNKKERQKFIAHLNIPTYNNQEDYYYYDILTALCREVCKLSYIRERISYQKEKIKKKNNKDKKLASMNKKIRSENDVDTDNQGGEKEEEEEEENEYDQIIHQISETKNIEVVEKLMKNKQKIYKSIIQSVDKNKEFQIVFDSNHHYYVPIIQNVAKQFLKYRAKTKNSKLSKKGSSNGSNGNDILLDTTTTNNVGFKHSVSLRNDPVKRSNDKNRKLSRYYQSNDTQNFNIGLTPVEEEFNNRKHIFANQDISQITQEKEKRDSQKEEEEKGSQENRRPLKIEETSAKANNPFNIGKRQIKDDSAPLSQDESQELKLSVIDDQATQKLEEAKRNQWVFKQPERQKQKEEKNIKNSIKEEEFEQFLEFISRQEK